MASLLTLSDDILLYVITLIFTASGFYFSTKLQFKTIKEELSTISHENQNMRVQQLQEFKEIKSEYKEIKDILIKALISQTKTDTEMSCLKEELRHYNKTNIQVEG